MQVGAQKKGNRFPALQVRGDSLDPFFFDHGRPAGDIRTGTAGEPCNDEQTGHTVPQLANMRHWTINGDFVGLKPYGVARYAREVTLALDRLIAGRHPLTQGLQLEIVAPREPDGDFLLQAIPIRIVREFRKPRLPQFWVQAQLPWQVDGGLLSFCNLAPIAIKRQIVCIHDLHTRIMPESYGSLFRWAHRIILPILGRRAAAIATVSHFSAGHIAQFGVAAADKITVTYNGADHAVRWDAKRSTLRNETGRPYVLCLARRQKYKNLDLLIALAPMLDQLGIDIWMAGDIDKAAIGVGPTKESTNIRLLGHFSDDDFKKALDGALCFLFPSRIEGFGIPAVEAMTAGCPVIASTAPCLPEICGDAALYADPDEPSQWIGAIRSLHDSLDLRHKLRSAGTEKALEYTWRRIAETYLRLMAQIDAASSRNLYASPSPEIK